MHLVSLCETSLRDLDSHEKNNLFLLLSLVVPGILVLEKVICKTCDKKYTEKIHRNHSSLFWVIPLVFCSFYRSCIVPIYILLCTISNKSHLRRVPPSVCLVWVASEEPFLSLYLERPPRGPSRRLRPRPTSAWCRRPRPPPPRAPPSSGWGGLRERRPDV